MATATITLNAYSLKRLKVTLAKIAGAKGRVELSIRDEARELLEEIEAAEIAAEMHKST